MEAAAGIVGFAASLVALVEVLLHGCRLISKLQDAISSTSSELERLRRLMETLLVVMREVKTNSVNMQDVWHKSKLQEYWSVHSAAVHEDITSLCGRLAKIQGALDRKSLTSKNVRARILTLYMENDLERYERLLDSHKETFSLMLGTITEYKMRSQVIMAKIEDQGTQINALTRETTSIHALLLASWSTRTGEKQIKDQLSLQVSERMKMESFERAEQVHSIQLLHVAAIQSDRLSMKPVGNLEHHSVSEDAVSSQAEDIHHSPLSSSQGNETQTNGQYSVSYISQRFIVYCQIFNYQLPLGTVTGRRVVKESSDYELGAKSLDWVLDVTLFPFKWLTNSVYTISMGSSAAEGLSFRLRHRSYNDSPELKRMLDQGNIAGIRLMFSRRDANPQNILQKGNTLLHEVVLRQAVGVPNMIQLCQLLLRQGCNPDDQNDGGRTPLIQACRLMRESLEMGHRMLPIVSLMIERGGQLFHCDEEGHSAFSLLFQSQNGVQYIEEFVYRFVDLDILEDLQQSDCWLVSALARCSQTFRHRLEAQLRDFRTPPQISSDIRPREISVAQLKVEEQVKWLTAANREDRVLFMRMICSFGSVTMVRPFIESGIDVNETNERSNRSYIRAAARRGNLDIVHALHKAGAVLDQDDWCSKEYVISCSVIEDLVERWDGLRNHRPGFEWRQGLPESEYWILGPLLQNPNYRGPNALLGALWWNADSFVFERLLQCAVGRRDGQAPTSWELGVFGSEVIEAVKLRSPHLKKMLDSGLALECEDRLGCTALLHALDMGSISAVRELIAAGANLSRRTGYGITPLEFAKSNLRAGHPRPMQRSWVNKYEWQNRYKQAVSMEDDRVLYDILKRAAWDENRLELPFLTHNGNALRNVGYSILQIIASVAVGALAIIGIYSASLYPWRRS